MDIPINLASQPYQQVQALVWRWRLIRSATTLLAVILVGASLAAVLSWRTTQKQALALAREIREVDRRKTEAEAFMDREENRQLRSRAEFLNAALARKAFSWTEVFSDLEHIMPPHLRVSSIHPEINLDGQLELHLALSGSERGAAIELLRRLETSPHFTQAQISTESAQAPQNAHGDSIQYSISAIYIPAFARASAHEQQLSYRETQAEGDSPKEALNAGH